MHKNLKYLRNVGKATLKYLDNIGIQDVQTLAKQDASDLYCRLQNALEQKIDPCMWDLLAAIIHEAKTQEKTDWWEWTSKRKKLQAEGKIKQYK